ncbi:MAG: acetate--CoA ligase family protein [Clostridia bacterium]|nr:acetate--CoA ligase family protein [Clostridia bacterium]
MNKAERLEKLKNIMYAKSIAVIGASIKKGTVGNELIKRLIEFGYKGKIYPVNIKYDEIEGIPAYASVLDIKQNVDLAVIAVPSKVVLDVIKECHSANISGIVLISSGFKELNSEGLAMEKEISDFIKKNNMMLIGPNCLGILNTCPNLRLNACFAPVNPIAGKIGLATQSGALASGIINILPQIKLGLRQMISIGNQADVNILDIIEFWENDDNIEQILLYIESIPDNQKFREICERVNRIKPIIVIKSGRTETGTRAAASHTGALAGDDVLVEAMLSGAGVIREKYLRDMFETAQVFSHCVLPKNENLAILTNAGGPGVLATDTAGDFNIKMAELSEGTKSKLRKVLPPQAGVNNPLDVIASATREQYTNAAEILLDADEVGVLLVIYLYITTQNDVEIIQDLENLKKKYPDKPIISVFMTTADFPERLKKVVKDCTIPIFNFEIEAVHGLKKLLDRKHFLTEANMETPKFEVDKNLVKNILNDCKEKKVKQISTLPSLKIFDAYGIPLAKYAPANTFEEASKIAEKIGYPVVLKISSDTITHKTDVGGVVTNIKDEKELKTEWDALLNRMKEINQIEGLECVIVMKQIIGSGREFVAGIASREDSHLAMFGLGGVFLEVLKEVEFSSCPLSAYNAKKLVTQTKALKMMGNVRGYKSVSLSKMQEVLLRLSQMVSDFEEIKEIDVNPIMATKDGEMFAVDARIILK